MRNILIILKRSIMTLFFFISFLLALTTDCFAQGLSSNPWTDISESSILSKGERLIIPLKYRTINIDPVMTTNILKLVPVENNYTANKNNTVISIPFPDGKNEDFYVTESPVMEPELAAKFPELKTYIIEGVDKSKILSGKISVKN